EEIGDDVDVGDDHRLTGAPRGACGRATPRSAALRSRAGAAASPGAAPAPRRGPIRELPRPPGSGCGDGVARTAGAFGGALGAGAGPRAQAVRAWAFLSSLAAILV